MPAELRFQIKVDAFRPVGAMNTTVTMKELTPGLKSVAELNGSYYIKVKRKPPTPPASPVPEDDAQEIKMTFVLETNEYRFLGIAFAKRGVVGNDPNAYGQVDFPTVVIQTVGGVQEMTVTNMRTKRADGKDTSFDYAIQLQELTSGVVGSIDPEIVNEN